MVDDIPIRTASGQLLAANRAVRNGERVAMDAFRTGVPIEQKTSKMDTVTRADVDAQSAIVRTLGEVDDGVAIVGEEGTAEKRLPDGGRAWVVDPIDGTNNFVRGSRVWSVCLAHVIDGEPTVGVVSAPALGDRYVADPNGCERNGEPISVSDRIDTETFIAGVLSGLRRRHREEYEAVIEVILDEFGDLRRIGSGQLTLAAIASGEIDAAISTVEIDPWDTIAGVHLVRQAGGRVTDLDGDEWTHDSAGLVASNGTRHGEVLRLVRGRRV